jgi:hypothetical protein
MLVPAPGTPFDTPNRTVDLQTRILSEIERRGFNFFVLMVENYRSGLVWKYFMRAAEVRKAMIEAGVRDVDKQDRRPMT